MIGSISLLCVDEPEWTERVREEITQADDRFEVTGTQSPREALSLIGDSEIDCVVSAYDLPEQTGLELLRSVREIAPELPFVVFIEAGAERVASDAISAGVSDYMVKEASGSQYAILANRLRTLVEAYRAKQIVDASESNWTESERRANDIYYMFTSDWSDLLYINSVYEEIWGGSIADLREDPRSFLEYVHPDDREMAVESMQSLSAGEPTDVEYRIETATGETRWVRGLSEPICNAEGEVVRIMGAVRDISRLTERERRFQAVFEESFDAMVIADDDGDYIAVNDAACELFGLAESDLLGRNVTEFAATDFDVEEAWEEFQSQEYDLGTFPLQRPDGTVRTVEYAATTDVVPGEHLSVLRDVTDRERQRRELAESKARYETLIEDVLDTSSVGTFILDGNFEIVWVNRAIEEYFGIDRDEVLGMDKAELVRTELKHKFADPERFAERVIETYTDNSSTVQFECKIRDEDTDTWRWLDHWSRPIRSGLYEGGRIEHYTDLTERKERDRQLQVLERVLRHNLLNKMTTVLGFAETIAAESVGETRQQAAQIIQTGNELLALSEKEKLIVELVRNNYQRQPVEIASPMRDTIEAIQQEHTSADITTELPAEAQVLAVPEIDRAVDEVIENAVTHSDGPSEIAISMDRAPDQITIVVRDDNPHIPQREKDVLAGDVDITQMSHSRGLGLWVAYWLVSESNGTVAFERVEGGNEVRITLPAP